MVEDVPPFITKQRLESVLGPTDLGRLLSVLGAPPSGTAEVSTAIVEDLILRGSARAAGLLKPGFSVAEARDLVAADPSLQDYVAWLCIGIAGRGKAAFQDASGKSIFNDSYNEAFKALRELGTKGQRAAGEDVSGHQNALVGASRVNIRANRPRKMIFARTRDRDRSGPF